MSGWWRVASTEEAKQVEAEGKERREVKLRCVRTMRDTKISAISMGRSSNCYAKGRGAAAAGDCSDEGVLNTISQSVSRQSGKRCSRYLNRHCVDLIVVDGDTTLHSTLFPPLINTTQTTSSFAATTTEEEEEEEHRQ